MIHIEKPDTPEEAFRALYHHGIKGQKWGVRKKYEPSPRDKSSQVGVDPVTVGIGAAYVAILFGGLIAESRKRRRMSNDSGEDFQRKNANIAWKTDPSLSKKMSIDDLYDNVVTQVNPNYGKPGTKMNCRRCTFSYEMRRRGFDVRATPSHFATGQDLQGLSTATRSFNKTGPAQSVWGQHQISSPLAIANSTAKQRSDSIYSALSREPNGARGELAVSWSFGGGHSMAWEIVNNKPVVIDAQSSKVYRDADSFSHFATVVRDAGYTRTDNLKLDDQFLKRWMTNA